MLKMVVGAGIGSQFHNTFFKKINEFVQVIKKQLPEQMHWYHFIGIFLLSFLLITLRRPDIFLYPQFWAEDGGYWFKDAYNGHILASLVTPMAGYLQTVSRLAGALATLFPLSFAPLVFNLIAISIKILPILFLLSQRFQHIIPRLWVRIALSLAYIALPNTSEVFVNVTNAHWHLALLAVLIFIAEPSRKKWWNIFDGFFIALLCLSGPFSVFLIPAVILRYIASSHNERKQLRNVYIIFSFFTTIQLVTMLGGDVLGARQEQEVRYSVDALVRLITGQIYIASLIGQKGYSIFLQSLQGVGVYLSTLVVYSLFILGTGIMTFSFIKSKKELRIFVIFCLTTFAFSLVNPMVPVIERLSQWQIMAFPGNATRYYFLPMIAFLVSVFALFYKKNPPAAKLLGCIVVFLFIRGFAFDFFYPAWPNYHYREQVAIFKNQPSGSFLDIQIVPSVYKMRLYKK